MRASFHPFDEGSAPKEQSEKKKKGQKEPPASYSTFGTGLITSSVTPRISNKMVDDDDDLESRGIVPLDSMADDDSVVLSNIDRYDTEAPRDPAPIISSPKTRRTRRKKMEATKKKVVVEPKKMEPEAFERVEESFQTMDLTVSIAATEAGSCVDLFDVIFLCVDNQAELQKAQSKESEYSDGTGGNSRTS